MEQRSPSGTHSGLHQCNLLHLARGIPGMTDEAFELVVRRMWIESVCTLIEVTFAGDEDHRRQGAHYDIWFRFAVPSEQDEVGEKIGLSYAQYRAHMQGMRSELRHSLPPSPSRPLNPVPDADEGDLPNVLKIPGPPGMPSEKGT